MSQEPAMYHQNLNLNKFSFSFSFTYTYFVILIMFHFGLILSPLLLLLLLFLLFFSLANVYKFRLAPAVVSLGHNYLEISIKSSFAGHTLQVIYQKLIQELAFHLFSKQR